MEVASTLLIVLVNLAASSMVGTLHSDDAMPHSRPKRYVVFPQGSYFSIAFCMSFKTLTDDDIYTGGMNLAMSYKLPNETLHGVEGNGILFEPLPVLHRRHRREIYRKLEIVFNSVGMDGRACMLRALCESAQRFIPRSSLISELIRILLTMPLERVRHYEPEEHHQYDEAHRRGLEEQNCVAMFPTCSLSLVDIALGLEK